jgi:multidrug efflux pump subunit AcrB
LRQAASGHGVPQPAPVAGEGTLADDVLTAVGKQNLILPGGTAKMGHFEYEVDLNAELKTVQEFNDLPIKTVGGAVVYLRDVATVSDGFAPQTNVVRQNGSRGALLTCSRREMPQQSMSSKVFVSFLQPRLPV